MGYKPHLLAWLEYAWTQWICSLLGKPLGPSYTFLAVHTASMRIPSGIVAKVGIIDMVTWEDTLNG
jgi:hypothetical protein